jgi:hypothetical protein
MGARWPWIVAGSGLLLMVGMGVVGGLWLANGGIDRLSQAFDDGEITRRSISRLSRRLSPPIPIEPQKVAGIAAIYIQDGALWARPFSAAQARPVISDPSVLGYRSICCMMGPDQKGRAVGYGFLPDGSGEVFQVDLSTGEFIALAKQNDSRDDVGYWQAQSGGLTAIWMPEKASSADRIPVGKIRLLDSAGKLVKQLNVSTARRTVLSKDGRTIFAVAPRSRAYADWMLHRNGAAPEKMGTPEAEVIVKIDVATERVTDISPGYDFMISWDEQMIWADMDDSSKFLTPEGKEMKGPEWSDNMLWSTEFSHSDLVLGLHVPWPDEAQIARRTCEDEFGAIAAYEPSTSKLRVLDTICYRHERGPELSFGPWSGTVVPVKGR